MPLLHTPRSLLAASLMALMLAACFADAASAAELPTSSAVATPTAPATNQHRRQHTSLLMNTPRPLFFSDLVALDTRQHSALTLPAQRKNFAFAASAHLLPLAVTEIASAVAHYPIVFVAEGDVIALVALTGLPDAGNRFVGADGEWRSNTYIPAYVRGYPFIAVRVDKDTAPVIALDPNAADFKAPDGQQLIGADGQPGEQLKGILAFHGEYQTLIERTHQMNAALKNEGVLEDGSLNIQTPEGKTAQIGGFLVVNETKLRALSADALKRLMDADALGLAYGHLLSMGNLNKLLAPSVEATTSDAAKTAPQRKPARARAGKTVTE